MTTVFCGLCLLNELYAYLMFSLFSRRLRETQACQCGCSEFKLQLVSEGMTQRAAS
jgi:hypothetical protein